MRDLAMPFHHRHPDEADLTEGATSEPSVVDAIERAHRRVWRGVARPPQSSAWHVAAMVDGHDAEDAYDAEVATLSAHLAAVEAVLHPAARRHLAGGRADVAALRRRGRHLERVMRLIEGHFYGDTYAIDLDLQRLQRELKEQAKAYGRSELELARRLDAALAPTQRSELTERFGAALKKAPTRPHPYTPHPRGLARPLLRACSVWDHALDVMDNRRVPGKPARRRSRALSRWDHYFLGTPEFDDEPQDTAPTPPAEAASPGQGR